MTRVQAWGNSHGVRLPKTLLSALQLEAGATVEVELSAKKDAIVIKPAPQSPPVRGRHRIEDLAAAMPKGYKAEEFGWSQAGREIW